MLTKLLKCYIKIFKITINYQIMEKNDCMSAVEMNEVTAEKVQSGRVARMAVATALAIMAALSGCNKKDSLDKCVGEETASSLRSTINEDKRTCHERVDDFVKAGAGERSRTRADAVEDCNKYSKQLQGADRIIRAAKESARLQRQWSRRESCRKALKVTQNKGTELLEGDMKRLLED